MKKIPYILTASMTLVLTAGCSNLEAPFQAEDVSVGKIVRLSLGGDYIHVSDLPLTRADGSMSYIGVNVESKKAGESSYSKYAYGVFTDPSKMELELFSGYQYRFTVTTLHDRTDKLAYFGNDGDRSVSYPFVYPTQGSLSNMWNFKENNMNKFISSDKEYLYYISTGAATVLIPNESVGQDYRHPRVDRYYGVLSNYELSQTADKVTIDVDRKNFGISVRAKGLPEGSVLSWRHLPDDSKKSSQLQFEKATIQASDAKQDWEDIYSLNDLSTSTSSSEIRLEFTLKRNESVSETYQVKFIPIANVMKVFNIDFSSSGSQNGIQIVVNEKQEEMQNDSRDIDWSKKS